MERACVRAGRVGTGNVYWESNRKSHAHLAHKQKTVRRRKLVDYENLLLRLRNNEGDISANRVTEFRCCFFFQEM